MNLRPTSAGSTNWWQTQWLDQARCLGEDPELFFPPGTAGPNLEQVNRAKAICAGCPVRAECLEWSLATRQDEGIWGGMTAEERRALRESRRPGGTG
jgi:WhiB family redox-sensing transcriptional regulator